MLCHERIVTCVTKSATTKTVVAARVTTDLIFSMAPLVSVPAVNPLGVIRDNEERHAFPPPSLLFNEKHRNPYHKLDSYAGKETAISEFEDQFPDESQRSRCIAGSALGSRHGRFRKISVSQNG